MSEAPKSAVQDAANQLDAMAGFIKTNLRGIIDAVQKNAHAVLRVPPKGNIPWSAEALEHGKQHLGRLVAAIQSQQNKLLGLDLSQVSIKNTKAMEEATAAQTLSEDEALAAILGDDEVKPKVAAETVPDAHALEKTAEQPALPSNAARWAAAAADAEKAEAAKKVESPKKPEADTRQSAADILKLYRQRPRT